MKRFLLTTVSAFALAGAITIAPIAETEASALDDTKYTYDALGRITVVKYGCNSATKRKISYSYDKAGNRTTKNTTSIASCTTSNSPPVANADYEVWSNDFGDNDSGNVYVLGNDTDADGDSLTITAIERVRGTTISCSNTCLYMDTNGSGSSGDAFADYYISDGNGGTDMAYAEAYYYYYYYSSY